MSHKDFGRKLVVAQLDAEPEHRPRDRLDVDLTFQQTTDDLAHVVAAVLPDGS